MFHNQFPYRSSRGSTKILFLLCHKIKNFFYHKDKLNLYIILFYAFLTPPALTWVPVVRFHVRRAHSLSSFAFERVTQGRAFTNTFPLPLPTVTTDAAGGMKHTNKLCNSLITWCPLIFIINLFEICAASGSSNYFCKGIFGAKNVGKH